jgi:cytochrome c oxidase accessory protein FixG
MPDDNIQLFAKRRHIHPRDVWGRYRRLKWYAMGVLLAIYYFVPWLRWDRGEHVPDQAILIDMSARRAYFFFIEIWPQEVYYLTGLLILAAVGLFFITSLFGRVWCGYACPQTVWTDLFIKVEYFFQGDRNARVKRDQGSWNFDRLWRKAATHATWILIALCTGGAWVFYFNDAPTLGDQIIHAQVPWSVMSWVLGLTASTYIMAGFAREQVCTYMCPYARFQSAMFDKDTLIISYETDRGEPRGPHKAGTSWEGKGDCIDCGLCVAVCPTGIDIRNGLQMECIACGLCVDACNGVMDKIERPRGLIRYDTTNNQIARGIAHKSGAKFNEWLHLLRPRTFYYAAILGVVGGIMLFGLFTRTPFELHVIHDRNPLFVQLSSGAVRNNYTLKILNKTRMDADFALTIAGVPDAEVKIEGAGSVEANHLPILADSVGQFRVLVTMPHAQGQPHRLDVTFKITDNAGHTSESTQTMFIVRE